MEYSAGSATYHVNRRFVIKEATREVFDEQTKARYTLEPRVAKVLFWLMAKSPDVVTREFLIAEVWNDYPGGGEGLNQTISFLRKILDDERKTVIQTIPKSGYALLADIDLHGSEQTPVAESTEEIPRNKKPVVARKVAPRVLILLCILCVGVFAFWFRRSGVNGDLEKTIQDSLLQARKTQATREQMRNLARQKAFQQQIDSMHRADTVHAGKQP